MAVRFQCSRCGRNLVARETVVFGSTAVCPGCLAEVAVPESVQADRPMPPPGPYYYGRPDIDVRRDQQGTNWAVVALIGLGVIGVAAALATVQWNRLDGRDMPDVPFAIFVLAVSVVVQILLLDSAVKPATSQAARRLIVGVLVAGLTVLAVIVYLFIACMAALSSLRNV